MDKGLTIQQKLAAKFEDFLLEHMTKLGMKCTRDPELPNRSTPDFLVEHEGRVCYVEATHMELHSALHEKHGEVDLKRFLEEVIPPGRGIRLSYEDDDAQDRLTDHLSRRDQSVAEIARWARDTEPAREGPGPSQVFEIRDIRVKALLLGFPAEAPAEVIWSRGYSYWGNQSKAIKKRLRGKYRRYTSSADSLGEAPLVIALFAEMTLRSEVEEALYVQGVQHRHLAGVWFFESMGEGPRQPCLLPNPSREDLGDVIPAPMLRDMVWRPEVLPTPE